MAHLMLPKFKADGGITVQDAGMWYDPGASLDNIGESMDIDVKVFDINSIPDIWARPLLFQMALFSKQHPLHKDIVRQWRGLLTLFALRDALNIKLDIAHASHSFRDGGETGIQSVFAQILKKLEPTITLDEQTKWDDIYVINCSGVPIGMTSPTTLVCTATDCTRAQGVLSVNWYDGQWQDPAETLDGNNRGVMVYWLENLHQKIVDRYSVLSKQNKKYDDKLYNNIISAIDSFITDLKSKPAKANLVGASLGFPNGIFESLNMGASVFTGESHVELIPSESITPPTRLLVIHPGIGKQWGVSNSQILVYNQLQLSTVQNEGPKVDRKTFGSTQILEAEKCFPETDFFTDKVFLVNQANAFVRPDAKTGLGGVAAVQGCDRITGDIGSVSPMLPIKKELLDYLTTKDIVSRVNISKQGEEIEVQLRLTLRGVETGREMDFTVSKRYPYDKQVVLENVPVIEIWPRFTAPNWKLYYTFSSTADQKESFHAAPFVRSDSSSLQSKKLLTTSTVIAQSTTYPEALICASEKDDIDDAARVVNGIGIIPLGAPLETPSATHNWRIGVDFGTSSTNVYYTSGQIQTPIPLELSSHLASITTETPRRISRLYREFIPPSEEIPPFFSVYHELDHRDTRPILDGHIFFLSSSTAGVSRESGIHTNLKWGIDDASRRRLVSFLKELVTLYTAEAISKGARTITWNWAYPTAFSEFDTNSLRKTWEQILRDTAQETGISANYESHYTTESIAAVHYFEKQGAGLVNGTVFLDVGGGTSDISIWQRTSTRSNGSLIARGSLLFAGEHIFKRILLKQPKILLTIANAAETSKLSQSLSNDPLIKGDLDRYADIESAHSDFLMREYGSDLIKVLPLVSRNEHVLRFIQLISLASGGLMYYVGQTLKYLSSRTDDPRYDKDQKPTYCLGGNGSRALEWINAVLGDSSFIIGIAHSLVGLEGIPSIKTRVVSAGPKPEVAYGLASASDTNRILRITDHDTRSLDENLGNPFKELLAGEKHEVSSSRELRDWDSPLTPADLHSGVFVDSIPAFENYITEFNSVFQNKTDNCVPRIQIGDRQELLSRVNTTLAQATQIETEKIRVEPVFLILLKTFLELEATNWARSIEESL